MPATNANGIRQFYRLDGNEDKPVVFFVHSLGTDHSLWDRQAHDLLPYFRVLRCDIRGHGATEATAGDYTVAMLSADVLALAAKLSIHKFALCGLSLGGMIGQYLGANTPDRLTHLILANTSAKFPAPEIMEGRRKAALAAGMNSFADAAMQRAFLPESIAANQPFVASMRAVLQSTDPTGYAGCCAAIRDLNQLDILPKIYVHTLIIGGDRDISTPWQGHGDVLAANIPHSKSIVLPAAHLSNLERPHEFSAAILDFLRGIVRPWSVTKESPAAHS